MSVRYLLTGCLLSLCAQATPGLMDGRVCTQERLPASDISVYFNLPAPAASQVTDVANWRIRYFYAASDPQDANINSIDITGLAGGGEVDFSLQAVPPGPVSVLIQYSGPGAGSSWTASFPCPAFGTATEKYKAATGKDDADIYISGGYSPATAATPLFSADVNLGLRSQISGSTSWQLTGSMKTDSRKKADPDSFRFRGAMVFDAASAYAFSVNMGAGMEFDRQGRARNVIASPRFSFVPMAGVHQVGGKLLVSGALEIRGGIETGVNTNPVFRFKNTNFQGTDGIFRGVPGATVYLNFFDPRVLGLKFKKISVLSSYDVRLLTKDEIFLETRTSSPDPIPQLRRQPRSKVETAIAFKFTDALGFTIKHEHGSLPPAFVFVQNKLTFGILLQLKESRGLRP